MQLMSLKCPNCNALVEQTEEGKFHCPSCGTSFLADYDREDVEYARIKTEAEIKKRQLDLAEKRMEGVQGGAAMRRPVQKSRAVSICIVVFIVFVVFVSGISAVFTVRRMAAESQARQQREEQRQREQEVKRKQQEEERKLQKEAEERRKEEERQALLASYKVTPEELMADPFFKEHAKAAILGQVKDNTNLFYTNWNLTELEYLTSYIFYAKDDNEREHNYVANIYRVHWDKVLDDRVEHYVMYDGACLQNVSRNTDGTIRTDYVPHELSYHSEIVANQFLSGYTDLDQLIRIEIYGNADYDYVEFDFESGDESAGDSGDVVTEEEQ